MRTIELSLTMSMAALLVGCGSGGTLGSQATAETDGGTKAGTCVGVPTISYFPVPPDRLGDPPPLNGIVAGPDGNVWFTVGGSPASQHGHGEIGRITLDGTVTEFDAPGNPYGITVGSDGALWAAGHLGGNPVGYNIYRVTTDGTVTPHSLWLAYPQKTTPAKSITAGPDGNLWFTTFDAVGSITTAGSIVEYPLPSGFGTPNSIAAGPDGQLYFTTTGAMGRVTTGGTITSLGYSGFGDLAFAPDQAMWLTNYTEATITRIAADGVPTTFAAPDAAGSIAYGPDGNLWFTERYSSKIGRITPSGEVTEFTTRTISNDIAPGPDGSMWFCQTGFVGRITTR